jgi:hypothetical protein
MPWARRAATVFSMSSTSRQKWRYAGCAGGAHLALEDLDEVPAADEEADTEPLTWSLMKSKANRMQVTSPSAAAC